MDSRNPDSGMIDARLRETELRVMLRGSATMTREIHIVSVGLVFLFLGAFVIGVW
jgi:hypothetical protein